MDKYNDNQDRTRRRKGEKRTFIVCILLVFLLVGALLGYSRYVEPYLLTTATADFYTDTINYERLSAISSGKNNGSSPTNDTAINTDVSTVDYSASVMGDGSADDQAAAVRSLKIVVFADTHFSDYYTTDNFRDVVERINSEKADLVFFLGDLVDDLSSYKGSVSEIENELASIQAGIGKYAVFGNHDYGGQMQFQYPGIMEAGGFTLLVNEYNTLDGLKLGILGIDDLLIGYGDPKSAGQLRDDYYNIVLCHEPDVVDKLLSYDVDLMLSGHTHGRQINLAIFDSYILPAYGRKYIKGQYDFENDRDTKLYVTSGIGMTKLPLRYGTPPEINAINISKVQS